MQVRSLLPLALLASCVPAPAEIASAPPLPNFTLADASFFPAARNLNHAEDGVVLPDGRLLVGDAEHGLVTLDADGSKTPFGTFAEAGFIAGPAAGWSNPNGIAWEPDGVHVLVADIVEGKIFRTNTRTGAVQLLFDHEFGVNTAVRDSQGTVWFTQSTRNPSGPDAEARMYAAVDRPLGDGVLFRLITGPTGKFVAQPMVAGFDFANGVLIDEPRGRLYVAESLAGRVRVFEADFSTGELGRELPPLAVFSPDNIEMDEHGMLWIASPFGNEVLVVDPDSGAVHSAFRPTPATTTRMTAEITRRLAAGEGIAQLLGPDLAKPLPGPVTGVILTPGGGPVYVSGLGDALVKLQR